MPGEILRNSPRGRPASSAIRKTASRRFLDQTPQPLGTSPVRGSRRRLAELSRTWPLLARFSISGEIYAKSPNNGRINKDLREKLGYIDRLSIVCLISIGHHLSHIYEAAGLSVQVLDFYKAYNWYSRSNSSSKQGELQAGFVLDPDSNVRFCQYSQPNSPPARLI